MNRWTTFLLNALASLADTDCTHTYFYRSADEGAPRFTVDLDDAASVRTAFCSIVEWEWGSAAFDGRQP